MRYPLISFTQSIKFIFHSLLQCNLYVICTQLSKCLPLKKLIHRYIYITGVPSTSWYNGTVHYSTPFYKILDTDSNILKLEIQCLYNLHKASTQCFLKPTSPSLFFQITGLHKSSHPNHHKSCSPWAPQLYQPNLNNLSGPSIIKEGAAVWVMPFRSKSTISSLHQIEDREKERIKKWSKTPACYFCGQTDTYWPK